MALSARLPRPLLLCSLLLLAGVLAFGLGEWRRRARRAAELETQAKAFVARPFLRPSHAEQPTPGSFRELATPLMPRLQQLVDAEPKLDEATAEACREVREGTRPFEQLPEACQATLERGRALMREVLRATRAERGGMPEGIGPLDDPAHPLQRQGYMPLQHVQRLAALQLRSLLHEGRTGEALDTCLDMLALARELGLAGALVEQMVSVSTQGMAYRVCASAIESASVEEVQRARPALARLATGWEPFSETLRTEALWAGIVFESHSLGEAHLRALPPGLRALALSDSGRTGRAQHTLLQRFWRWEVNRRLPALYAARIATAELPPALRAGHVQARCAREGRSFNPLDGDEPCEKRELGLMEFAGRIDRQRTQLAMLVAAAGARNIRAATGHWPTSLEGVPNLPVPRIRIADAQHAWVEPPEATYMDLSLTLSFPRASTAGREGP